jgi:cardiolipin synthase A/B
MNVGKEYEHTWHDVHARVEGSAVAELERLFLDRWRAAGEEAETPAPAPESWPGDMSVDVVAALPGVSQAIKARYLREVDQAQARVLVENAYFLEDDIISSMCRSAGRGVRNVLVIPADKTHDVGIVRDAFAFVANDVVRAGVELYKYDGRMTHAKVAAFDGRVATVGSSNLDSMALTKLAECNLFVNDHRFARTLEERVFVTDLPRSTRQGVRKLSWWEKVKGGTLHLGRSFL